MSVNSLSLKSQFEKRIPLTSDNAPSYRCNLLIINELCGQMGHLIGPSGIGKDQLHDLVEAMMRSFRDHDNAEYKKLEEWARQKTTKGSNKDKPGRKCPGFLVILSNKGYNVTCFLSRRYG